MDPDPPLYFDKIRLRILKSVPKNLKFNLVLSIIHLNENKCNKRVYIDVEMFIEKNILYINCV